MSTFSPNMGIPMTPEQYAEEWGKNSIHFNDNNFYGWMSEQVTNKEFLLEIGCGTGFSTLSLMHSGSKKIVVIESNLKLINTAEIFLKKNNIPVSVIDISDLDRPLCVPEDHVFIIIGNLFDEKIQSMLLSLKFDCISCWLIGADPATVSNGVSKHIDDLDNKDMAIYREKVHHHCYLLGESLLKPNGVMHFVDRGGLPDPSLIKEIKNQISEEHKELSNHLFEPINTTIKLLDKSFETSKVQYSSEQPFQIAKLILTSVVSRKKDNKGI